MSSLPGILFHGYKPDCTMRRTRPGGWSKVTRLTRRGFLVVGATGAAGAVLGAGYLASRTSEADLASGVGSGSVPTSTTVAGRHAAGAQAPAGNRWSDPASWSDGVPGPDMCYPA